MSIFRTGAALCAAALLASCTQPPARPSNGALAREERAVDALGLKRHYQDVVMGTDIKGTTLILYVDENNLQSMDEPVEDAMIDQTLAQWKNAWRAAHPHKHATVRLSLRNYYGTEILGKSAPA